MIKAAGEADNSDQAASADEERKIERNQRMASQGEEVKAAEGGADDESDDWEDCDVDDGEIEPVEEANSEEEESSEPSNNSNL